MDEATKAIMQTFPGAITAVNIVILLSAIFFFTSTIASHVLEYFAGWRNCRGNQLEARLKIALGDNFEANFRQTPLIQSLMTKKSTITFKTSESAPDQYPSYIPADTFATAALSVFNGSAPENVNVDDIKNDNGYKLILNIKKDEKQEGDVRKKIADWYNDINERQNGSYTRWSMLRLFAIGFVVSFCLDIDVFHLVSSALNQPKNLDRIVTKINEQFPTLATTEAKNLDDENKKKLGIYIAENWNSAFESTKVKNLYAWQAIPNNLFDFAMKVIGWILTAIATSLGAQFWFNTLSEALKLRAAGPKPNDKTEKGTKKAAAAG